MVESINGQSVAGLQPSADFGELLKADATVLTLGIARHVASEAKLEAELVSMRAELAKAETQLSDKDAAQDERLDALAEQVQLNFQTCTAASAALS